MTPRTLHHAASLALLTLGVASAWAQATDPFADNPFPVPYKQAPTDPALRWAGFQSRVGTYLPTDPYHWWRFDPTNRAEIQDAYWREEMVAATVPLGWNGSFATLEPGKTTQAWRNAVLREVNLHRYIYGNGSNYLVEDLSYNPTLQAAAFVGAWREDLTHNLTAAMMPPGFAYTDLAITGAYNNCLGLRLTASTGGRQHMVIIWPKVRATPMPGTGRYYLCPIVMLPRPVTRRGKMATTRPNPFPTRSILATLPDTELTPPPCRLAIRSRSIRHGRGRIHSRPSNSWAILRRSSRSTCTRAV